MAEQLNFETTKNEPRSFDNLVELWGHKLGFDNHDQLLAFRDKAAAEYTELRHHNFQHAIDVAWVAMELADLCENKGDPVNRKALFAASLWHDAGYHQDFMSKGFDTAEAFSVSLFKTAVSDFTDVFSERDIEVVEEAILATQVGVVPITREQRIMVRADLDNVGSDFESRFFRTTISLIREAIKTKRKLGQEFDIAKFSKDNIDALAMYLLNNLSLGRYDEDYPAWLARAQANVEDLSVFFAKYRDIDPEEFIRSIGGGAVTKFFGKTPLGAKNESSANKD